MAPTSRAESVGCVGGIESGGSVKLTVAVTALCLLLGYPAAYFMVRVRSTLSRTILYAIVVSPLLISVIVRSYVWVVLLANNGVINGTLLSLGLIDRPLRMLGTFGSVIVATVHVLLPFMVFPLLGVMTRIDTALVAAARSLGASPRQAFLRTFLPLSLASLRWAAGERRMVTLTEPAFLTKRVVLPRTPPAASVAVTVPAERAL